jgi:hypothetical protein
MHWQAEALIDDELDSTGCGYGLSTKYGGADGTRIRLRRLKNQQLTERKGVEP